METKQGWNGGIFKKGVQARRKHEGMIWSFRDQD